MSSLPPPVNEHSRVAILGAGFGGLGMAIRLLETGRNDFTIFEKAAGVGGTWRENTYPGCACDIASHLYSFSFEQDSGWSRTYAQQPEILRYLERVAAKHNLSDRIRFHTEIVRLDWDDGCRHWRLTAADGRRFTADVVVAGVGGLHVPRVPEIPGLESFVGPAFHSARWRHDVDLADKLVAVIGTGASAIQIIPAIAPQVARLLVFQRTPPWVLPRHDRPVSRRARWAFDHVPGMQRLWRTLLYIESETIAIGFTLWPWLLGSWQRESLALLARHIKDPALRAALTPQYTMGCKRVLLSDDYYPALARDNVEVTTAKITAIRPHSIVTADGVERPVDVLVLATGFRTFNPATEIDIRGRGGRRLADGWAAGPEAYNGLMVAGYPNLFLLMGPNSGLGHNSIVFMLEAQVRYVLSCLELLETGQFPEIDVRPDVQQSFNEWVQRRFVRTVWGSTAGSASTVWSWRRPCSTWYRDPSGRLSALWPGFSASYWWRLRRAEPRDFSVASTTSPATADSPH
jgi:cation diffusion facilitator CzcD-associated flavoprotein CzcO